MKYVMVTCLQVLDTMSSVNKEFQKFNIKINLISSLDFSAVLRSFSKLIASSIGPKSKFKIVQSEGGIEMLTSSSKRLMEWIELNSPVLQVIANSMKGQWQMYNDFGLYTGLISAYVLIDALNYHMPFVKMSNMVKLMSSVTVSLLESSNIKIKVDFSSIKNLLPVVLTIITSKPLCCSSTLIDVEALSLCIVGGFIHGFSEDNNCLGRVSVIIEEGPGSEAATNFSGVLYPMPEVDGEGEYKWNASNNCGKKRILVVLFTDNLSTSYQRGNGAEDEELAEGWLQIHNQVILNRIETTCEKLLAAGVSVFACQKVVHPNIQLFLQRRGALVLERMGKELADSFAVLSGAVPISEVYFEDIPEGCIGEVETVEHIIKGHKNYILLKRESCLKGVATILAFAAGEQEAAELKVVIHQCLQSLCHLYSYPFVYPGSGCLEMWLAEELQSYVLQEMDELCDEYQCSKLELVTVLHWFRSTFLQVGKHITGLLGPITVMDSVYHHCWSQVGASTCCCGLLNRNSCDDLESEWSYIEIDDLKEKFDSLLPLKKLENIKCQSHKIKTPALKLIDVAHVDVVSGKLNAYRLAFETCQSILEIGMVVY